MMERTPVRGGIEPETVYLQAVGALCRSRLGALFEDDEEVARRILCWALSLCICL